MAFQNWPGGSSNGLVATGITAAGTTQGTATQTYAQENEVTTVSVSGAGVVINPLFAPGEVCSFFNAGANPLKVYPPTGVQINALPANAGFLLSPNTGVLLRSVSTTRIIGVLSA